MARKPAGLQANLWDATRVRLRPRRSAGPRAPAVGSIGRTATLHRDAFTSASHPSRGAVWSTAPSGEASVRGGAGPARAVLPAPDADQPDRWADRGPGVGGDCA